MMLTTIIFETKLMSNFISNSSKYRKSNITLAYKYSLEIDRYKLNFKHNFTHI